MINRFSAIAALSLICLGALTSPHAAAATSNTDAQDKLKLDVGFFFYRSIDTTIRLDKVGATGTIGTSINLSRDLDVSKRETAGRLDGYYRFSQHHRVDWSYFNIKREGTRALSRDIEYGDISFSAGETVNSFLNVKTEKLAYTFSFHHDEKVELGIGVGLHFLDIEAGIATTSGSKIGSLSSTAPLPVVRALIRYQISPKWSVQMIEDSFIINIDDYTGGMNDTRIVTEYMTFDKIGFGFGFQRFTIDLDARKNDFSGSIESTYNGFLLYVTSRF